MADTLANTIESSPYTEEMRRAELDRRQRAGLPGTPQALPGSPRAAVPTVTPLPESAAPTQKEPSVPKVTPGSSPLPSPEVGGVSDTVAQTQSEVNSLLGKKPSARKLRDAVAAYEEAAAGLKEQSADTREIDAALRDARQAYREKADRNELLSLVQMVAQGFAKLAAYNYGSRNGRYVADQVNVPSVDYEKRTDHALDELRMEQSEGGRRAAQADRAAERSYAQQKDKANSLKERIGAEESALSRESSMYGNELSAARARELDAARAESSSKRDRSLEEKFNRQFGAKEVDNVQQEEAILRQKEQAVTALAGAMAADDKRSRAAIPSLAAKAGVSPEEVEKFKADTEKKGIIWDSADPKAAAAALSNSLLPGVRERLDDLRKRKEQASEMMRTGESLDRVKQRLEGDAAAPKVIKAKATGETRPYTEELWKKIQASPQAADFTVE